MKNTALLILALLGTSTQSLAGGGTPAPVIPAAPTASSDINAEINSSSATTKTNFSATQTLYPQDSSYLSIWQGFDHEWLRFIIDKKGGRIPHRISKFNNFIDPASNNNQLVYQFGQNTGVDGNYMHPKSSAVTINTNGLFARKGKVSMQWTDNATNSSAPVANNKIRQTISIPFDGHSYDKAIMFLQGIELDLHCDNSKQPSDSPCNSNGMWPYVFNIQIEHCVKDSDALDCQLNVDIFRAWTPNKGGFQLIGEVKPLNYHLDYDLNVYFAAVAGSQSTLASSGVARIKNTGNIYQYNKTGTQYKLTGASGNYNTAATIIKGIAFRLTKPSTLDIEWKLLGSDVNQRGRYIARTRFQPQANSYSNGVMHIKPVMEVWAPGTVVNSNLTTEMRLQLLQFGGASSKVSRTSAEGKICLNSKDQAPFFSAWHKCDRQTAASIAKFGGIERSQTAVIKQLP